MPDDQYDQDMMVLVERATAALEQIAKNTSHLEPRTEPHARVAQTLTGTPPVNTPALSQEDSL